MSKRAQELYDTIDGAMEEFTEEYDKFYTDDVKKAAKDARKALQTITVAAKELRKVIQADKTGKPVKKKKAKKSKKVSVKKVSKRKN